VNVIVAGDRIDCLASKSFRYRPQLAVGSHADAGADRAPPGRGGGEEPRSRRAVRLEFESRDGELTALGPKARAEARRNFNAVLSKLELPNAKAAQRTIGRIAQLAALGQERFTSATTGRSDPVARMTAARMAAA